MNEVFENCYSLFDNSKEIEAFTILIEYTENNNYTIENDILRTRKSEWKSYSNRVLNGELETLEAEPYFVKLRAKFIKILRSLRDNQPEFKNIGNEGNNIFTIEIDYLQKFLSDLKIKYMHYVNKYFEEFKEIYIVIKESIRKVMKSIKKEIESLNTINPYA